MNDLGKYLLVVCCILTVNQMASAADRYETALALAQDYAVQHDDAQSVSKAIALYDAAIGEAPEHPEVYIARLAKAYLVGLGRNTDAIDRARKIYLELVDSHPVADKARREIALAYLPFESLATNGYPNQPSPDRAIDLARKLANEASQAGEVADYMTFASYHGELLVGSDKPRVAVDFLYQMLQDAILWDQHGIIMELADNDPHAARRYKNALDRSENALALALAASRDLGLYQRILQDRTFGTYYPGLYRNAQTRHAQLLGVGRRKQADFTRYLDENVADIEQVMPSEQMDYKIAVAGAGDAEVAAKTAAASALATSSGDRTHRALSSPVSVASGIIVACFFGFMAIYVLYRYRRAR